MTPKRQNPIPEFKKKLVASLAELIKSKKTILLASVKNVSGSQYQQIVEKIRGKAIVKLPKKNLFFRAVEEAKNEELKKIEGNFKDSTAVLFSDSDSFDLASDLMRNKTPAKAKVGQEAPEDIKIDAGPTDLPPGPAISELGAVGLQVEIKEGKIHIKEAKVIVKKGDEITQAACDIMNKLGIQPFSIGFLPLSAYDTAEKKFYENITIDFEGTLEELKTAHGKALAFAVEIGYASPDTITFLLGKAASHEKVLDTLVPAEPEASANVPSAEESKEETPKEEGESKEKKEEVSEETPKGVPSSGKEIKSSEGKTPSDKNDGEEK